jgi:GT2 family glycosyltransferase
MSLSIIIVNYRAWSFLSECLQSLLSDPDSSSWQIIVADNDSDDGQLDAFKEQFREVEFIACDRNGGFAYGCNSGARKAEAGQLLFLNPDVVVEKGQVEGLLKVKRELSDVSILTATQVNGKGQAQKTWDIFPNLLTYLKSMKSVLRKLLPRRFPNPRERQTELVYCDWVSGAVLLIARPDFDELGRWCEDYWLYSEDCDLCYLASTKGWKVACTPEVTFLHHHGGASRQNQEITVLTKTEAIISKHVFNQRHRHGVMRLTNHALIILATLPELFFWALLDLLTFRQFKVLSIRRKMLVQLVSHYKSVFRTRDWRSRRTRISA